MSLHAALRTESIRRLEEGRARIHRCLDLLAEEHLWHRPNAHVPAVGNLVLHLCGNVGQWIGATLGGRPDARHRQEEFTATGPMHAADLLRMLDDTLADATRVIGSLDEAALLRTWRVQGFAETGAGILVHVVEHFSYHVGQITLHTKLLCAVDTGYYSGQDLDVTT